MATTAALCCRAAVVQGAWGSSGRRSAAAATAAPARAAAHDRAQQRASANCSALRSTHIADASATAVAVQATAFQQLAPLDDNYEANCTFADFANWLIPGQLLVGRYPFIEPSRCRSRSLGEDQLRQLLSAGVTTFVCLQAELPDQSEMRIGGVNGFLPYRASAQLLASAMNPPPSMEEIAALRTPELDRYLPPRRHPSAWESRKRIELNFLHSPIVDLSVPDADKLRMLLAQLTERIEAGETLYVHCWGGRGRAGTVGACLLAQLYGISADEALERVQRSFDTRKDEGRPSPETDEQREFVRRFVAEYIS